jgi:AcrR family transcriptional regulator
MSPEIREAIEDLARSAPDVESGDEEFEDVRDYWIDLFDQHASEWRERALAAEAALDRANVTIQNLEKKCDPSST